MALGIDDQATLVATKSASRVIKEYGADKSLEQCMARLADFVAANVA